MSEFEILTITKRSGERIPVLIDSETRQLVEGFSLHVTKAGYPRFYHKELDSYVMLHRLVMGVIVWDKRVLVDHINGNPLDCRKINLRLCSHSSNLRNMSRHKDNRSGFKGVSKEYSKYVAYIFENGKPARIGTFKTPLEAAIAYDKRAMIVFGEFARLNFPEKAA